MAGKVCFCSPKMYQNSTPAMQNTHIFPGVKFPDPFEKGERERTVCFRSPNNAEFYRKSSGGDTPDPYFSEEEGRRGESFLLL